MQDVTVSNIVTAIGIGGGGAVLYLLGYWMTLMNVFRPPYGKWFMLVSTLARVLLVAVCFMSMAEYVPHPRWLYITITFISFEVPVFMITRYFHHHPEISGSTFDDAP